MEILFIIWLVIAIATAVIASNKGRSGAGWFFIGLLGGIFALIVVAVIGSEKPQSPTLTAQLEELRKLKKDGLITQDQYDQKKASLLS